MSCGAELEANALMLSLMQGEPEIPIPVLDLTSPEFELPGGLNNPLYTQVEKMGTEQLTTREINGTGVFDGLMMGVKVHLKEEFDKGRITGAEYSKAYVALTQAAIGGSVQFLLGKDQAYWGAVQAQLAAFNAKIQMKLAAAEMALTSFKARSMRAEYAFAKLRLSTESINYCVAKYNLDFTIPKQNELLTVQVATATYNLNSVLPKQVELSQSQLATELYNRTYLMPASLEGKLIENASTQYSLSNILPVQSQLEQNKLDAGIFTHSQMMPKQLQLLESQWRTAQFNVDIMLPTQRRLVDEQVEVQRAQTVDSRSDGIAVTGVVGTQRQLAAYNLSQLMPAQVDLVREQKEVQRAQTMDVRSDGNLVTGSTGKQKDLYTQQITSYKRDSEYKAAKLFVDAWITQKTLDEGLPPPAGFQNNSLDNVLAVIKANNSL